MPGLVALPLALLESRSWRCLSPAARRLLNRLEALVEIGAAENGAIRLSRSQAIAAGIKGTDLDAASNTVQALGLVAPTASGWRLTYAAGPDREPPGHEWRAVTDHAMARELVHAAATASPSPPAVQSSPEVGHDHG